MHPPVYRGVSRPGICVLLRDRVVERQPRAPRRGDVVLSALQVVLRVVCYHAGKEKNKIEEEITVVFVRIVVVHVVHGSFQSM